MTTVHGSTGRRAWSSREARSSSSCCTSFINAAVAWWHPAPGATGIRPRIPHPRERGHSWMEPSARANRPPTAKNPGTSTLGKSLCPGHPFGDAGDIGESPAGLLGRISGWKMGPPARSRADVGGVSDAVSGSVLGRAWGRPATRFQSPAGGCPPPEGTENVHLNAGSGPQSSMYRPSCRNH